MLIANKIFDEKKTHVMGILNVTPDSFSDGGSYRSSDDILRRTEEMISEGASIIDVGGESTRPGYTQISDDEEISRVAPVIESIKERFDITVSVDTYKNAVAEAAIKAGADILNDIWGLQYDDYIADTVAKYGVSVVLMHNKKEASYNDFVSDWLFESKAMCENALSHGIERNKIIIDPGVGFAKSYEQNLLVMKYLDDFGKIDYPVLLGTSRKSVIGNTLNLPVNDRLEGTLATTALAVMNKVMFVRVHDVKENVRVIKMLEAIYGA